MDLTSDDLLKILKIIDESPYDDVRLEIGKHKLHVQKEGTGNSQGPAAIAGAPAASLGQAANDASADESSREERVTVRAPMLGIFHRAAPGRKTGVEVGDKIAPGDALCSIDVLGVLHPVTAGVGGMVAQILVEDATLVEYDQPLIRIDHGLIDEWGDVQP